MTFKKAIGKLHLWLGLGGKIVAFLISLLSASVPVTGTLLWWGRHHKKVRHSMPLPA